MFLKLYNTEDSVVAEFKANKKIYLRTYQKVGRDWLFNNRRAMLTDWPGLGKTIQAAEASVRPVLVSVPTYLAEQWYTVITEQFPDDKVMLCTGKTMHRFDRQARLKRKADWYIINHGMFRDYDLPKTVVLSDEEGDVVEEGIRTVILDESHHFRNRNALQSIGAARYTSNMDVRVYQLSATPVWKNTDDIWMQLHILQPELFSSYEEFLDTFLIVDDSLYGPKVLGIKRSVRKQLDALLSIVKFGRTYKQVGRHLPETIRNVIDAPFPKELEKKYKEVVREYCLQLEEDEAFVFSSYIEILHTLRAITNWPGKQEALLGRLEDINKPTLVFAWYKETAYALGKLINKSKNLPGCLVITGDMPPAERGAAALKATSEGKHVVASLNSMSEGVNLQHLRNVIFYEEDWPPGKNFQALSRVVRDRNDNGANREPVIVDCIHVPRTIDVTIHMVAQQREASIKDLMKEILM